MKYSDRMSGSIEAGSLMLVLFASAVLSGLAVYAVSCMQYSKKNQAAYQQEVEIKKVLNSVVFDMQIFADDDIDYPDDPAVQYLQNKYANFNLRVTDVSSGYHVDFMPDALLSNKSISEYLFVSGSADQYLAYRNSHGISLTKKPLEQFIKNDVMKSCTVQGWLNVSEINTFAFNAVVAKFNSSDIKKLFPLVNNLPMMNVNMMKPETLTPILLSGFWGLKNAKSANEKIIEILKSKPVSDSDLVAALGMPLTNKLFVYLGSKTAFWEITFTMNRKKVTALAAGIPVRTEEDSRKIAEYRLLDWSMRDEP